MSVVRVMAYIEPRDLRVILGVIDVDPLCIVAPIRIVVTFVCFVARSTLTLRGLRGVIDVDSSWASWRDLGDLRVLRGVIDVDSSWTSWRDLGEPRVLRGVIDVDSLRGLRGAILVTFVCFVAIDVSLVAFVLLVA